MTDKEDKDSIEGSDSSNGNIAECVVPKKTLRRNLKTLSYLSLKKMCSRRIIRRGKNSKKLGINTIADELRKTAKK